MASIPSKVAIRRELRRMSPDVRIEKEQIKAVLLAEVIKREVIEGEKADEARKKISRAANRALRTRTAKDDIPPAANDKSALITLG
jgi:hypothetical protein